MSGSRDTRQLLLLGDVIALSRPGRDSDFTAVGFELLRELDALLGCDEISLQVQNPVSRRRSHVQRYRQGEALLLSRSEIGVVDAHPLMAPWWVHYYRSPFSLVDRVGRPVVTSVRCWYGELEWRKHPLNVRNEYHRTDVLLQAYPFPGFDSVRITASRLTGTAFGEREIVLMRLLEPHLERFCREVHARATPPVTPLTPRQRDVLALVQQGMSNRQIGTALGLSEATVRKHLQATYERLGVRNRTGAAALALG